MFYINTLGEFDVKKDARSILDSISHYYRLEKLFKYFITYRDKKLAPETIIEDLWKENNFKRPKNTLRTQISRLRRIFDNKTSNQKFFHIDFSHGYYTFHIDNEKCILDVEKFEEAIETGYLLKNKFPKESIDAYKKAIALYKGRYLSDSRYEDWLIPISSRYERIYFQALYEVIKLLVQFGRYREVIELCERGISLDLYNEKLSICYIEMLLKLGENQHALDYYEHISLRLYADLGIVPSHKMKKLYKKIKRRTSDIEDIQIDRIDEKLNLLPIAKIDGALECKKECIYFLYNLERRRNLRNDINKSLIGVITIKSLDYENFQKDFFKISMEDLKKALFLSLEKGDVYSIWNDKQMIFMLFNISSNKDKLFIKNKINEKFDAINNEPSTYLEINIRSIES